MAILEVKNLTHTYSGNSPFMNDAVSNLSLTIDEGEIIGIIGHTGSGKSVPLQRTLEPPELMLDEGDGLQLLRDPFEVGRGNDFGHAAVPGQPGHPDRRFHIPGSVIHFRHDMAVDIHHKTPLLS